MVVVGLNACPAAARLACACECTCMLYRKGPANGFPPLLRWFNLNGTNPTKVWKTGFLPRAKKVDRLPPGLTKKELDQRKGSGRERNFPGLIPFYRLSAEASKETPEGDLVDLNFKLKNTKLNRSFSQWQTGPEAGNGPNGLRTKMKILWQTRRSERIVR